MHTWGAAKAAIKVFAGHNEVNRHCYIQHIQTPQNGAAKQRTVGEPAAAATAAATAAEAVSHKEQQWRRQRQCMVCLGSA